MGRRAACAEQKGQFPHLSGVRSDGFLGRGSNNTYWKGALAEVLVYDRALSADERMAVERYLMSKHFEVDVRR